MGDSNLQDPMGRALRLFEQTWSGHILPHHPEMAPLRKEVENAILNPLEIRVSPSDADCRFYFSSGPRKGIFILVVGDVVRHVVKTAHLVRAMKGVREWSRLTLSKGS